MCRPENSRYHVPCTCFQKEGLVSGQVSQVVLQTETKEVMMHKPIDTLDKLNGRHCMIFS